MFAALLTAQRRAEQSALVIFTAQLSLALVKFIVDFSPAQGTLAKISAN